MSTFIGVICHLILASPMPSKKLISAITFILSDGTNHDVKVAPDLIDKIGLRNTDILCADKGYDSDPLRAHNEQAGCINNIL